MSTETRQRTCEERLPEHLAGRLEDLEDLIERMGSEDWEEAEKAQEEAGCYGLGLSLQKVVRWDLSTGGPGDWLEFLVDEHDELVRIDYVFQDWFDGARKTLKGSDFDAVEEFFEIEIRPFVEVR